MPPMRTLLMHDLADDTPYANALATAGHQVVRCSPNGRPQFPCAGARGDCPLDATVDVAVVVHDRSTDDIAPGEAGVVCALRDRIPLVVAGANAHSPFGERVDAVAASVDDVPAACERAVAARLARAGRSVTDATGTPASIARRGDELRVTLPPGTTERQAVLVHQAVRREFPTARSIFIGTTPEDR